MRALLAISLATTTLFCVAAHSQGVPLPPIALVKPSEAISPLAKAFHGRWEGRWGGTMPHVLVVEQIKSDTDANTVYAWEEPPTDGAWSGGWAKVAASIDGGTLKLPLKDGAKAWYEVQGDGSLKAYYQRRTGAQIHNASMKKVAE